MNSFNAHHLLSFQPTLTTSGGKIHTKSDSTTENPAPEATADWTPEKIAALVKDNKKLQSQIKQLKYAVNAEPSVRLAVFFPPYILSYVNLRVSIREKESKLKADMSIMAKFNNSEVHWAKGK